MGCPIVKKSLFPLGVGATVPESSNLFLLWLPCISCIPGLNQKYIVNHYRRVCYNQNTLKSLPWNVSKVEYTFLTHIVKVTYQRVYKLVFTNVHGTTQSVWVAWKWGFQSASTCRYPSWNDHPLISMSHSGDIQVITIIFVLFSLWTLGHCHWSSRPDSFLHKLTEMVWMGA